LTDKTYVDNVTLTDADSFNDFNRLHYTIFGDPTTLSTARYTFLNGMDKITNSLAADVAASTSTAYFTGPTVAQGTAGTWFASGTVSVFDGTNASNFRCKLWDGTTVIDSGIAARDGTSGNGSVALSGYIVSPAGNIRISVQDSNFTSGVIKFNLTGESKDSTLTAIRIG